MATTSEGVAGEAKLHQDVEDWVVEGEVTGGARCVV